jgi:Mor family transcriptional regulator
MPQATATRPNPKSPEHRAQLVAQFERELAEVCRQVFAERAPHSAEDCAARLGAGLRTRWGSSEVYIPASDTATRDRNIRKMFNGKNLLQVCHAHGVSPTTVYRIVGVRVHGG